MIKWNKFSLFGIFLLACNKAIDYDKTALLLINLILGLGFIIFGVIKSFNEKK